MSTSTGTAGEDPVLTALQGVGEATAAAVAARAGLAYSTGTRRLRDLEQAGAAQRFRGADGRTFWRPTTPTSTAATPPPAVGADLDPATGQVGHTEPEIPQEAGPSPATAAPAGCGDAPPAAVPDPDSPGAARDAASAGEPEHPGKTRRRRKGALRQEVLAVLQDRPDDTFKVSQLSKAEPLQGASLGAIANALHTLVNKGMARQVTEKPATYQAE